MDWNYSFENPKSVFFHYIQKKKKQVLVYHLNSE